MEVSIRHGHAKKRANFYGHKLHVITDAETELPLQYVAAANRQCMHLSLFFARSL